MIFEGFLEFHNMRSQRQLDPQLGAKKALLRAKTPPTWSQNGAKTSQLGAKMAPKTANLEPRCPPEKPRAFPGSLQNSQLGATMAPITQNLEPIWLPIPQLGARMAPKAND